MITPSQTGNQQVKPKWNLPVGVMEGIVAYNCRKHGFPRPVLAMPMWEGAGNRAIDYSRFSNTGSINGATWVNDGLDFNGSSDNMALLDESAFDGFTELAISFWAITDDPTGDHIIISKRDSWTATGIPFEIQHSNLFQFYIRGNNNYLNGPAAVAGKLNHVVCTWDGAVQKIYINGDLYSQRNMTDAVVDNNATVKIASRPDDVEYWNGTLGNIMMWVDTLSAQQAKQLYDDPYLMYRIPEELFGASTGAAPTGAIMKQLQKCNLGASLYNGGLII